MSEQVLTPRPDRRPYQAAVAFVALCTAWVLLRWLLLCATKAYAIDEFYYAHRAWAALAPGGAAKLLGSAHGLMLPLLYAPFVALADDDPSKLAWLRGAPALMGLCTLAGLSYCAARGLTRHRLFAALVLPLVAMLSKPLAWYLAEIRPDGAAFGWVVATMVLLRCRRLSDRTAAALAGVCLLVACLTSLKVVVYGAVFAPVFVLDLALRRAGAPILRRPWIFAGAFMGALAAVGLLVVATGHAGTFLDQVARIRSHQKNYPGFGAAKHFMPWFTATVPIFALAGAGVIAAAAEVVRSLRQGERPGPELLELLLLASALASFVVQKAPYPYSLVPAAGMVTLFAVRGALRWAPAPAQDDAGASRLGPLVAAASLALVLAAGAHTKLTPKFKNARQTEVLTDLHALAPPGDTVYDMAAAYVFRPPPYRMEIIDRFRGRTHRKEILKEVPAALEANKTMVFIYDARFRKHWNKTSLGHYMRREYQRYDDDLWVRGRRWARNQHGRRHKFKVVRQGEYFVWPPKAHSQGVLQIDEKTVVTETVRLEEGPHTIQWKPRPGINADLYVIWRPPTGETWNPKRKRKARALAKYILP